MKRYMSVKLYRSLCECK